jgi:zinc protease
MKKLALALVATSCLVAQPLPQMVFPSNPSNNVKAARATPIRRHVMRNGLRVLVSESPQEDMIAMEMLIQVGALDETTAIEGMGQIVQELLTRRVSLRPDGIDRIEEAAAQFRVTPEMDYVRISLVATGAEFPALFSELCDALKNRKVSETELEEVRKKLIENLDSGSGALGQLYDIFRQTFYRYHPYKRTAKATEGVIERIRPHLVETFLNQCYVANRMIISLSGRVDRYEGVQWVEERLAKLPQVEIKKLEISWDPKPTEKEVFLTGGGQLGWLFVGYPAPPAPSRDYAAMKLINSILGEGLSSRLFTEIREKRSLCYELGSMYPMLKGPSHFLTYTVTKPEQVWPARKQLLIEIERLKKEGVTPTELEEGKRKLIGSYWQERETNQGRAYQAAVGELMGLGYEFDSQFMKLIESVTTGDVREVAQRYLDNATLIVARPRGIFYWDI